MAPTITRTSLIPRNKGAARNQSAMRVAREGGNVRRLTRRSTPTFVASTANYLRWMALLAFMCHSGLAISAPNADASDPGLLCDAYRGAPEAFGPATPGQPNRAGMVRVRGGKFQMGSEQGYPEERNVHQVTVSSFLIDRHEVTNLQFMAFVKATGYVTTAERRRNPKDYPNTPENLLVPGGVIFVQPRNGEQFKSAYQWWKYEPGADWRHPHGPASSIAGLDNHPVVQVSFEDAMAYAKWLGHDLPTEAEYEYAARGGLDGATYPWGNTPEMHGRWMANTWQGQYPHSDTGEDGHKGTAPVGCYPPNAYGLFDAVGNVWEWTKDVYADRHSGNEANNPLVVHVARPYDKELYPPRVIKGGSYLCSPDFCLRYRPSSRQPQDPTLSTVHIGFRTVIRN